MSKSVWGVFAAVLVVGCSGGTDPGTPDDGGSSDASVTDGGVVGDAGSNPTDGGNTPSDGGNNMPTDGGLPPLDDSGQAALNGMDGITGTASGNTYTFTTNPKVTDYGTSYKSIQLEARGATGSWTITIPKKTGTFHCGTQSDAADGNAAMVLGPTGTGTAAGVPGSDCLLEVKSVIGDVVEGRFTAVLAGVLGSPVPVTSGYFHLTPGVANCADAHDPGVPDGQNGASVAITSVDGSGGILRCGENIAMAAYSSVNRDFDDPPQIVFRGQSADHHTQDLTITGLRGTGTFHCGEPGSAASNATHINLKLGSWEYFEGTPMGGSCTITVTSYTADSLEGSYSATLWNAYSTQHSTLTAEGHFRTLRRLIGN